MAITTNPNPKDANHAGVATRKSGRIIIRSHKHPFPSFKTTTSTSTTSKLVTSKPTKSAKPAKSDKCTGKFKPMSLVIKSRFAMTQLTDVTKATLGYALSVMQESECLCCGAHCILYTNVKCFQCVSTTTQEADIESLQRLLSLGF